MKRCEDCDFWRKVSPIMQLGSDQIVGAQGECHRRSPVVGFDRRSVAVTAWPQSYNDDGCGDWAAKQEQSDE